LQEFPPFRSAIGLVEPSPLESLFLTRVPFFFHHGPLLPQPSAFLCRVHFFRSVFFSWKLFLPSVLPSPFLVIMIAEDWPPYGTVMTPLPSELHPSSPFSPPRMITLLEECLSSPRRQRSFRQFNPPLRVPPLFTMQFLLFEANGAFSGDIFAFDRRFLSKVFFFFPGFRTFFPSRQRSSSPPVFLSIQRHFVLALIEHVVVVQAFLWLFSRGMRFPLLPLLG